MLDGNKITLVTSVVNTNTSETLSSPSNTIALSEIIVNNRLKPTQFSSARLDWSYSYPFNQTHITSLSEVEELDNGLVKVLGTVLKENETTDWDGESAIENGNDIWWDRGSAPDFFGFHEEIRTGCLVKVPTQSSGEAECGIMSIDASVDILNLTEFSVIDNILKFQFRFGSSFNGDTDGDIGVKDFNIALPNQTDYINAFNINTMNDIQNSPLISDVHELLVYVEFHSASTPNTGICEANIKINNLELLHYIRFKDLLKQDYYVNNIEGRKSE